MPQRSHRRKRKSFRKRIQLYFRRLRYERTERAKRRYKRKVHRRQLKQHREREKAKMLPGTKKKRRPYYKKRRLSNILPPIPGIPIFQRHNRSFLYQAINSTAIFIITYVLFYFAYQLTVFIAAHYWGMDTILQHYDLLFNDQTTPATRIGIVVIAFSAPILSLIMGFVMIRWVFRTPGVTGLQRLFVLWLALHGLNHFFGALISGVITIEGFGYVANWLNMEPALKLILSVIALLLLTWIGSRSTSRFLETSSSTTLINPQNRKNFLFSQAIIPWIAGSIIIILVNIPDNFNYWYEIITFITMGFVIIPIGLNLSATTHLKIHKARVRIHYSYIVLLLILILAYRVAMAYGASFTTVFDVVDLQTVN
ncbi:MAG: hypothetical protein U9R60_10085 [Bacteroidota bacterium]|nr:hypothetical protein [Bacteroidota bacterium]